MNVQLTIDEEAKANKVEGAKPLKFDEVRKTLGCGSAFLYGELQAGRIAASKLGKRWIIKPKDLERYLHQLPNNRKVIRKKRGIS